jgi:hypothetical protein
MFSPRRLVTVVSSALTLGVGAVLVLSATAPGSAVLRSISNRVAITAHAAGGGGGSSSANVTINPNATLVAKLGAGVTVSYTCQPGFDPTTGFPITEMSSFVDVEVQQRQGKTIDTGYSSSSGTAICDGFTVNQVNLVAVPENYPGFSSPPFKKGVALVSANVQACASGTAVSPPFFVCDFGTAGPSAISIK